MKYRRTVLVLLTGIMLLSPGTGAMLKDGGQPGSEDRERALKDPNSDYLQVPLEGPGVLERLQQRDVDIIDSSGWSALIKVSEQQKKALMDNDNIETKEIKNRTTLNFPTAGVRFDTERGPNLDPKWTRSDSQYHVVQYIAPTQTGWDEQVKNTAGKIERQIDNNAVVVKMTEDEKQRLQNKEFVEWIGPYHPGYKIAEHLKGKEGRLDIWIRLHQSGDLETIKKKLMDIGATDVEVRKTSEDITKGYATIGADQLPEVASIEGIMQVKEEVGMALHNNKGAYQAQAPEAWDVSKSQLDTDITGEGITVHVQDNGIYSNHDDFTKGALGDRLKWVDVDDTRSTHGTHTTATAAGSGYLMESFLGLNNSNRRYREIAAKPDNPVGRDLTGFAGRAPEAWITSGEGVGASGGAWGDQTTAHENYEARIFSNSWGPEDIQRIYDGRGDQWLLSNPDSTMFFSVGNKGPWANTADGNALDKNVIGVGATENFRPNTTGNPVDPKRIADFSSRGPAMDGRIAPDLVEAGEDIYSAAGPDLANAYDGDLSGNAVYEKTVGGERVIIDEDNDGNGDYVSMQGTSMACPAAAGDAALVRDYLNETLGYDKLDMRGDLVRALLIYGAEDIGHGYPSYQQGWGRVNVKNIVNPPAPTSYNIYEPSGESTQTIDVQSSESPLKAVMTYYDDDSTSSALNTDFDLEITSPSGSVYRGNSFEDSWTKAGNVGGVGTMPDGSSYSFDRAGDGGDDLNNIEMIRIKEPEPGTWTINTDYKEGTSSLTQSLVIGAHLNPTESYEFSMEYDNPRVQPLYDGGGNNAYQTAHGTTVSIPVHIWNEGSNEDTIDLSATQIPSTWSVSYTPGSSITIANDTKKTVFAHLTVPDTASAGTQIFEVTGSSKKGSDQDVLTYNIDVTDQELPPKQKLGDDYDYGDPSQTDATMESFTVDGTDYLVAAYRTNRKNGDQIMAKVSTDGGTTWDGPYEVSDDTAGNTRRPGLKPEYLDMTYIPSSEQVVVSWHGIVGGTPSKSLTNDEFTWVAYADSSDAYSSWTQKSVFENGEGATISGHSNNTYRTTRISSDPSSGEIWQIVECFVYDSDDLDGDSTTTMGIVTMGKYSTDQGTTWNGPVQISPAADTEYYFFPDATADHSSRELHLWYYYRPQGDANYGRDLQFQTYTAAGGWSATTQVTDDDYQWQFPSAAVDGDGTDWSANFRTRTYEGEGHISMVESDDEGSSYTAHNLTSTPKVDNNDYIITRILDTNTTGDGNMWTWYDPAKWESSFDYGPNPLALRSEDGWDTYTADYLTQNSYFTTRADGGGEPAGDTMNFAYVGKDKTGGSHDVYFTNMSQDWKSDGDGTGPETDDIAASDYNVTSGRFIDIGANVDDFNTGGGSINTTEYFWDVDPGYGKGRRMDPVDGSYDSIKEGVTYSAGTGSLDEGRHTLYIRGQDSAGNWGTTDSVDIYIQPPGTQPIVNITRPSKRDVWTSSETQTIWWNTTDDFDDTFDGEIYYSTDGGDTWVQIDTYTGWSNPNSYDWTIPDGLSTQALIRVNATDSDNVEGSGTSATFEIIEPFRGPNEPTDPTPEDGATGVNTSPTLSVNVSNPDGVPMKVTFYDASDDSVIGMENEVANGSTASVTWSDLDGLTEYRWYAAANDSEFETQSDTWTFMTKDITSPTVESIGPPDGAENVTVDTNITITFSESMNEQSVEDNFTISPEVNGTFSWNTASTNLTYQLDEDMKSNTTYEMIIGTDASDENGLSMDSDHSSSFTTSEEDEGTGETGDEETDDGGGGDVIADHWWIVALLIAAILLVIVTFAVKRSKEKEDEYLEDGYEDKKVY